MRISIIILFISLKLSAQNVLSIKISLPSPLNTPLPKVCIYNNGNLLKIAQVNANGNYDYTYQTINTTYIVEPYFDSIPSVVVDTTDARAIMNESLYVDAPNNIRGLYLNKGSKFWSADVKEIKKIDAGQGYLVYKKNYFKNINKTYVQQIELLCNGGFESNQLPYGNYSIFPSISCWTSNSDFEIWSNGMLGINAYAGNTFCELNTYGPQTNSQTFIVQPNDTLTIGFAHRARSTTETVTLSIQPVGGALTNLKTSTLTPASGWAYYTMTYVIPNNISTTQYKINIRTLDAGGSGNLIDAFTVSAKRYTYVSYYGPDVSWFKKSDFDNMSIANWNTYSSSSLFPITVTSGPKTLELKIGRAHV